MRNFDLQGHRGARGLMPENTLPGFAHALRIGVATLECDCAVTADGVVVLSHDRILNPDITRLQGRWLDQPGPAIHALRYEELDRYDFGAIRPGSNYARRFPHQQAMDEVRMPRLADLFELVARSGANHVRFNIETKIDPTQPATTPEPEAFVRAVMKEVQAAGVAPRTIIQSFDWRTIAIVRRDHPEVETACLTTQAIGDDNIRPRRDASSPWTNGLHFYDYRSVPKMVAAMGADIWSPRHQDLDRPTVDDAHALRLRVIPWTVNEPEDMARLIDWGVDGLITDYPDRLRAVMADKGFELPPRIA